MSLRVTAIFGALALSLSSTPACVSPSGPKPLRYYTAEAPLGSAQARADDDARLALRPRSFTAAGHLHERMAVHHDQVEYRLLELERWTEPPLAYVRRALERALFEGAGLLRSESLGAAALDLELLAFEQTRVPEQAAEIAFTLILTDGSGEALFERSLMTREPLTDDSPAGVAAALSRALDRLAREAAVAVRRALESRGD